MTKQCSRVPAPSLPVLPGKHCHQRRQQHHKLQYVTEIQAVKPQDGPMALRCQAATALSRLMCAFGTQCQYALEQA